MSDNIKVVVKVRPLISRELEDTQQHQWRVQSNTLYQLDSHGRDFGQTFTFDKVYNEDTKTSDVYNDVAKPIVEAATAGFNGTIFAYGQTSSGKTYTMSGTEASPGIIPLSVLNLFEIIKNIPKRDFLVRVSYIEIYNETLKDLLDVKKENIKIHETYEGCIKVDASERVTSSPEEVLEAMKEGEANRQTGSTNMNEKSSRSHSIFQITIESREHTEGTEGSGCVNVSQLNLVDLAGSERAGQTGATGLRFKEGTHINKSLSALALVIKQLSEGPNKYANYRDSKLTRILQNSLGGNAKTSIICAITPAALEETVSTLQFATRAKTIKNKPEVNAVATDATMIQQLTRQLSTLQSQLESKKNLELMLETKKHVEQDLQKQIANLQRLILNGFGAARAGAELGARRRQPPRRITISTLHAIDEDPAPRVAKFCTPTLKYNPMVIPNPSEFVPVQSSNKLASLPEEPPRLVTPPPHDKKVNFNDEVIEIDSDDDNTTLQTCSPYHKCYSESKTPPCVLRKNCRRAEENYREIVEFTEREKMYKPDVVELMEKLELSTNMTTRLQEEIELLRKNSKERDLEMEHLLFKVRKSEEDIRNAKLEFETHSNEYKTKLTDCEVSYEILKRKAKLREEELISLLEEHKLKKHEDIGKLPPVPVDKDKFSFMDMSKDISLVNSDNESIMTTSNEEECSELKKMVSSLQDQLIDKCQTIVQLEANIASQKQSIEYLEQSSHELQNLVDSFTEKNNYLENENRLYKSNIDELNNAIKEQKENLKAAQNDIATCNHVIEELQTKLTKKDNLLNLSISDSVLENMIANEEKVIANNENVKNIIQSFKISLEKRNKEIEILKSSQTENSSKESSNDNLNEKEKQINILNEENVKLKEDAHNNIIMINNLMREKSNLVSIEEQLSKKISELQNHNSELSELNRENILRITNLNETNENVLKSLSEKNAREKELVQLNNDLQSKLDEISHKITSIEEELNEKSCIVSSLSKANNDKQEYENHAKSALDKLKSVISILSGDIQEIPEFIENCVTLFNALSNGLCLLENVATDTISEKSVVANENSQLKTEIINLQDKFDLEKTTHQHQVDQLKQKVEKYLKEITTLKETNKKLEEELIDEKDKMTYEYENLMVNFNSFKETANKLNEDSLQNQIIIMTLKENEIHFRTKIDDLTAQLEHATAALKTEQEQLKSKTELLAETLKTVNELQIELDNKREEINSLQKGLSLSQDQDQHVENIFNRLCDISDSLNIEKCISFDNRNGYETIFTLLDKIKKVCIESNHEQKLDESKKSIESLLNSNQALNQKINELENKNKTLSTELEKNNFDMENLSKNLSKSNEVLEQLKKDLEHKVLQIQTMESKAQDCKDQFTNLDISMNQRMQDLRNENEMLKASYLSLKNENQETDNLQDETESFPKNKDITIKSPKKQLHLKTIAPPSLLTICCNKIVDTMEPKQNDLNLSTRSSSDTETQETVKCKTCLNTSLDLRILEQEKRSLMGILEQSERTNKELLLEQENIRRELKLLVEPAQELQKKLSSHKTNMSILTATTYAENRSLKSQVLALRHHHSKLLNVCEGDIPEFKKQLRDLFEMLKVDPITLDSQNSNFKRYSLPDFLDNNTTVHNFKNESTLDGDMLMLDTNVTLTTTGDNTLVGYDQTCLDLTQTMFNEVSCQTYDPKMSETNVIEEHVNILEIDSQKLLLSLEVLKEENSKLKSLLDKFSDVKVSRPKVDAQSSPIKVTTHDSELICTKCETENKTLVSEDIEDEVKCLSKKLEDIQIENQNIKKKYNDLVLEMPKIDSLVSKLKNLEKEYNLKSSEVTKLTSTLNNKNRELKQLQEENDTLSTQVMENISEADDLNKELHRIKSESFELAEKIRKMESIGQLATVTCSQCQSTVIEATSSVLNTDIPHAKLNRSLSDSETSSRYNKICTLQSELCAGREDCRALTEHVATIKQHLNCSNMSIDLDESMGDSNASQTKNFVAPNSQHTMCSMPDIQEEQPLDVYSVDKMDCYNYYLEITGEEKEQVTVNLRIIDIIKRFYNVILEKHGDEIAILANKLKEYEELQNELQTQSANMTSKYSTISNALKESEENLSRVSKFMTQIKSNINRINNEISNIGKESLDTSKIINMFKENFLSTLDYELSIPSTNVFEVIITNCQEEFNRFKEQYAEHKKSNTDSELKDIEDLKVKLAEKEGENNLLRAQNEKIREISRVVTLEIVKKDQDLQKSINEACHKLMQHHLIAADLALTDSATNNINIIIDHIIHLSQTKIQHHQTEIEELNFSVTMSKRSIDEKEKELNELKTQIQSLRDINNNITIDLADKETKIHSLMTAHDDLSKAYDCKIQENINKLNEIDKLTEEISSLTEAIAHKESMISSLSENKTKTTELLDVVTELKEDNSKLTEEISSLRETVKNKDALITSLSEKNAKTTELRFTISELEEDNKKLKTVNQMILKEKESYSVDLKNSNETIKQNIAEIEKMTSDILVLRESVKDATSIIESLKEEVQKLSKVNTELKQSLEEKGRECMRLEINIKTHVKTAELQSKMIMRLNKQREEDDRKIIEHQSKINEVNEKYNTLQDECDKLKNAKDSLEARVSELQEAVDRPRASLDAADSTRRRRQSIHDSKRLLRDLDERNVEDVFNSRPKPDDLFSETEDLSGRSTPFGNSRGHDSLSKTEQDEDHSSRPSSVAAARRRRQSTHDMHRGVAPLARHTPSPHDMSIRVTDELHLKDSTGNKNDSGEVIRLRTELSSCQQELEELKERYRELDEECETCAEYLRERDDQCAKLKKEKAALEKQILELKSFSLKSSEKSGVAHVAVNTDEDWANLHAVVVDRMSFDAEVEKNKRLVKTIEELRYHKQDLKNTLAKMQKALEKQHSNKDSRDLEATKKELRSVKEELEQLKAKYKELDEECETCAEYLKEREEQCRRLREAKAALESKLLELQEDSHSSAHSARRRRQTIHDKNRSPGMDHTDASTDTHEDLLNSQVERDDSTDGSEDKVREIKRLKKVVHQLTHQKAAVEQQLKAAQAAAPQPMLVATGSAIVQNQQLTDVMKENQRLKKMNAKLVNICKKRNKGDANRENEDPCEQG